MTREELLAKAKEYVCADRAASYAGPEESFGLISQFWSAYKGVHFSPRDVAAMMALLKLARIAKNSNHEDSWIDVAGYAACGVECKQEMIELPTSEAFLKC